MICMWLVQKTHKIIRPILQVLVNILLGESGTRFHVRIFMPCILNVNSDLQGLMLFIDKSIMKLRVDLIFPKCIMKNYLKWLAIQLVMH